MNHMCCIIRDMLPLYLDGMLSEDSVAFVEEHLQGCGACREELEKLKAPDGFPRETPEGDATALKAMKRKWNRRVLLAGILLAAAVLVVLAVGFFAQHWVGTARQGDAAGLTKGAESYLKTEGLHLERTQRRGNYMAALFTDEDGTWYMCEFDRDSVFTDRWRAGGSSGGSDGLAAGEMNDWLSGSPDREAVMIYCGVGLPEEAKWYAFRHDWTTYISPIEEGTVLDVFVVSDSSGVGTMPVLLDAEKEPLVKNSDVADYVLQRDAEP